MKRFSEEEKCELKKAYEEGLVNTKLDKQPRIEQLAKKLKRSETEIKNWIGNERRRSRTNNSTSGGVRKKPPQKIRAPNSYNLFVKDFFKTAESRAIKELAERNKLAAKKWQELGDDQKQHYHQLAVQVPSVSPDNATFNKWHETHRILSNLQDNCEWAERVGVQVFYVVCDDTNHYVGGTSRGRDFLHGNPHVPTSFMLSTKPGITPAVPEPKTSKEFRQMVQNQLNVKYSLAIGEPYTKVPYTKLSTNNVVGWPPSVQLRPPSVFSRPTEDSVRQHRCYKVCWSTSSCTNYSYGPLLL